MSKSITEVSSWCHFADFLTVFKIKEGLLATFNIGFFIANSVVYLFVIFYILFTYKKRLNEAIIKYLFYFTLLYAGWFILLLLRHMIPDFLSIVIANSFGAAGIIYLYLTVRALLDLEHEWHYRYWVPIAIIFMASLVYTYLIFDIKMRFFIYSSYLTFYYGLIAWIFYAFRTPVFKFFETISLMVFLIGSIGFFSISLYSLFMYISPHLFSNSAFLVIIFNLHMFLLSVWSVFVLKCKIKN